MRIEKDAPLRRRMKAKQVGGLPEYPSINLYAARLSPGIKWLCVAPDELEENQPGVVVGMMVHQDGAICFAPTPVPVMAKATVLVIVEHTSEPDETGQSAECAFALIYHDKDGLVHKQMTSSPQVADGGRWGFSIPLEHLDRDQLFACTLKVTLMDQTKSVLIRGVWIEVQGT